MPSLPSSLALQTIGGSIISAPHNNNFSAIQTAVNNLLTLLAGGIAGQVLQSDGGSTVEWASPSSAPSGSVTAFAGAAAPSGWLLCDGTAVSRTTYAALFAIVGTTYGPGDGSSTFNLPDLRGRMPVGLGTHADVDALNDSDGLAVGSRRPKHTHSTTLALGSSFAGGGTGAVTSVGPYTSDAQGPSYLTLNYIIKT